MNYEVKKTQLVGSVREKDEKTFTQTVNVTTGIVGDTYGFEKTNTIDVDFPSEGMDAKAINELIKTKGAEYVAKTYPNT